MICCFEGPLLRKLLLSAEPGAAGSYLFLCSSRHACQAQSFVIFIIQSLVTPTLEEEWILEELDNSVHLMFVGLEILKCVGIFGLTGGDLVSSL